MTYRILIALVVLCALGQAEAQAQGPPRSALGPQARRQFTNLVASRNTVQARAVQQFDRRLESFLQQNGVVPPPATDPLTPRQVGFRQRFVAQRFTPGARVDGVFFTTSATPSVPSRAVNVFGFFPVFRFGL